MDNETGRRFWEVDAARGVALLMMVLYHLVYDLDRLGGYGLKSTSGFWAAFADVTALVFVFLVGLSLSISFSKAGAAPRSGGKLFGKYLRRGMRIFSYGILITLVFWALSFGSVIFGILHLIGVSTVLAYPLLRLRLPNLFLSLFVIVAGAWVQAEDVGASGIFGVLLAPFGIKPEGLFMPDYRPLLPWFGIVLLGLFFGNVVYKDRRTLAPGAPGRPAYAAPVSFLGRHSLFIYLIHQPILIAALWTLGIIEL